MATQIPDQMQAQVLEEYNKPYTYKSLPIPKIASEHDILVKVDAASYCHTDAVMASGQMKPNPPYVSCVVRGEVESKRMCRQFIRGYEILIVIEQIANLLCLCLT